MNKVAPPKESLITDDDSIAQINRTQLMEGMSFIVCQINIGDKIALGFVPVAADGTIMYTFAMDCKMIDVVINAMEKTKEGVTYQPEDTVMAAAQINAQIAALKGDVRRVN